MPQVNLDELENAMALMDDEFSDTEAWVARDTGIIHIRNDEYLDEEAPLPADVDDDKRYVPIPSLRALDLGNTLVFRFAEEYLPGDVERVHEFFRRKGAYGRFSRLLEMRSAKDEWHRFRDESTRAALREWCEKNDLQAGA